MPLWLDLCACSCLYWLPFAKQACQTRDFQPSTLLPLTLQAPTIPFFYQIETGIHHHPYHPHPLPTSPYCYFSNPTTSTRPHQSGPPPCPHASSRCRRPFRQLPGSCCCTRWQRNLLGSYHVWTAGGESAEGCMGVQQGALSRR